MKPASPNTSALISIICRTVNRASLVDTLASVKGQSWPAIELVLVDALGTGSEALSSHQSDLEAAGVLVRIVSTGNKLDRPAAANIGLKAATGAYLLFLDDDDWIASNHLANLHAQISKSPVQVVYSATQKTLSDGRLLDEVIAVPFDQTVLRRDNFIPIHSALFSRRLLDLGCQFDESLAVYEDWDFWLQCAQHTDFMLTPEIGAFYRMGGDSQTMLEQHEQRYQPGHPMAEARAKLLQKWRTVWSGQQWNELLGLLDQSPQLHALNEELAQTHQQLHEQTNALAEMESLRSEYIALSLAHEELDRGVREILGSFSWRVTAPYRWAALRLRRLLSRGYQPLPEASATVNSGPLQGGLLTPAQDNIVFTQPLTVQAWAWSEHAETQTRASILVDGVVVHTLDPLPHHKEASEAQRIGFAFLIETAELSAGTHTLSLQLEDNQGHRLTLSRRFVCQNQQQHYARWLKNHHATIESRVSKQQQTNTCQFAVVIAGSAQKTPEQLQRSLDSVIKQNYSHWQIFLLDADTPVDDPRIHSVTSWAQISAELESGKKAPVKTLATLMQAGDVLYTHCLSRIAANTGPQTALVYSDHDLLDEGLRPCAPVFSFGWSEDLLYSRDGIGGVYFADFPLLTALAPVPETSAWRFDALLQLSKSLDTSRQQHIHHVAEVLWSEESCTQVELDQRISAEQNALQLHMDVNLPGARVVALENSRCRRVLMPAVSQPLVSIIIPTTGNMRFLKPCLDTLKQSTYPAIEVIILDNGRGQHRDGIEYAINSGATVIECNESFNWSRLNNKGVEHSHGELLLFLNDDIEIIQPDWLEAMVEQAQRDNVGTVGCLLLYPNGAIQHAGVFLVDHGGGARHLFHKQLPGKGIYLELDRCVRDVSASTGACLMLTRQRFNQLGGFDEKLSVVGNDIDLCLRAQAMGLRNVWTPHARLIHHESVSRQSKPIGADEKSMWARWGKLFRSGDPCYNPNLSQKREDCALTDAPARASSAANSAPSVQSTSVTPGVNLIAYIRASMGVGEASRGNAAALQASGVEFGIINYERGNPARMDNLRWQHKEISTPQFDINLLHINADHIPAVMKDLGQSWFKNRYNIGFWAWEMPEFPDRWLDSFDLLDEIWVPSTYVNQAVAAKSSVPVITIPHIINVDMGSATRYSRSDFGINPDAFVFVSLFDIHSIAQRKNPFGSILAFQRAFKADDQRVQLVIKINNADDANKKAVTDCIGAWQNILVLDQHMDRARIDSLINCSDCFVSLHHAEGFGLGPAEAMAMGKVALLTNWSGNTEYMSGDNCVPVRYTLKTLGRDYGPYEAHQHWAVPDLDHAAAEMKDLVDNPERARKIGLQAKEDIARDFSAEAIGERMRLRLTQIARIVQSRNKRSH